MTSLDRLQIYLAEAIRNTSAKQYRRVSEALVPVLPTVVSALAEIAADCTSTKAQRLQASEMLMALWQRCVRDEANERDHATKQ